MLDNRVTKSRETADIVKVSKSGVHNSFNACSRTRKPSSKWIIPRVLAAEQNQQQADDSETRFGGCLGGMNKKKKSLKKAFFIRATHGKVSFLNNAGRSEGNKSRARRFALFGKCFFSPSLVPIFLTVCYDCSEPSSPRHDLLLQ